MGRRGENIRKRKDGRWEARLIIGHGPEGKTLYRSVYGRTYLEAKNKRMELIQKTQAYPAKESADPELRMTQLFEEWLQDKKDRVKQSTYSGYQRLIDTHLDPDLGKYRLSELNDELLDRFLRDCLNSGRLDGKGGLSPKTVADIRSVLLLCLRYAKQKQYSCPSFDHLFCPRVKQPRISILSMEEQAKLEMSCWRIVNRFTSASCSRCMPDCASESSAPCSGRISALKKARYISRGPSCASGIVPASTATEPGSSSTGLRQKARSAPSRCHPH